MQGSVGHPALSNEVSWFGTGRSAQDGSSGGGYRIKRGIK